MLAGYIISGKTSFFDVKILKSGDISQIFSCYFLEVMLYIEVGAPLVIKMVKTVARSIEMTPGWPAFS